jgi:SAM-dependent methyltransferase
LVTLRDGVRPNGRTARRVVRLLGEPRRIPSAVRRAVRPPAPAPAPKPSPKPAAAAARPPLTRAARRDLITGPLNLSGVGLEIGPSHNPLLPKAEGFDVRIADYLDSEGLKAKYDGVRSTAKIEDVDYVVGGGRLTDWIEDRFDYIVASHVAEHTPCLISFLRDCETLLKPGGVLALALPDKRFTFDRFRERSSLGRVIDVYRGEPTVHSEGSALEHFLMCVRRDGAATWQQESTGPFALSWTAERALKEAAVAAKGEYVDTHNWVFTPNHFRLLLDDLGSLGFVGLRELEFHDTIEPEFFVWLSTEGAGAGLDRQELLLRSAREVMGSEPLAFT